MRNTTCLIGQRVLKLSAMASVEEPGVLVTAGDAALDDGEELGPLGVWGEGGGSPSGVAVQAIANRTAPSNPAVTARRRSEGTGERHGLMGFGRQSKPAP